MTVIVDAHAHLGYDYVFDENGSEEELLEQHERYGIDERSFNLLFADRI